MSQNIITKNQFHLLYDLTEDYVFFMRKDGDSFIYEYVNKKAEEIFLECPSGKRMEHCIDKFHYKTILYHYNRACNIKHSIFYQDNHFIHNETIVNETTVIPVFHGEEVFILATTREVTRTKEMQEATYILESYRKGVNDAALVAMTNEVGIIEMVNNLFEETSQFNKSELIGKSFRMINSHFHEEDFFENMWETIQKGETWRGQIRNRTKNGSFFWVDAHIIPITNEQGVIEKYLTIQFDNTEKKRIMSELRNIERSFKLITDYSNDLITITDAEGYVLYSSPSHETILKYDKEELLGTYYLNLIADHSIKILDAEEFFSSSGQNKFRTEFSLKTKDGSTIWTDTSITTVENTVDDQEEKWFVFVSREITDKRALEDQLKYMAFHDSLTGLPNRRLFQDDFPAFLSSVCSEYPSIGLLYIDGDNFKDINDQFGHEVGDQFLMHFAEKLHESVNYQYKVYRIGGDEFVILIDQVNDYIDNNSPTIDNIVQSIQRTLCKGWVIEEIAFTPTSSIGISIFPNDGITLDELLDNADQALYAAKKQGKNKYIYTSTVHIS